MSSRAGFLASKPEEQTLTARTHAGRHVHVAPRGSGVRLGLKELWEYRELFLFLIWRDIKARYSQTVLGAAWAVLQPVLTMVVLTVIFGRFIRVPSEGVPYAVFSLSGVVAWTYFATALTGASNSLINNTSLITKVYFPRLVIPSAPVLAALLDFGIALVVLVLVLLGFGWVPSPMTLLLVPLPVLLMMMTALGAGCWLCALNVQYRDVKYVTDFLVQLWMYASPIVYPLSIVPDYLRPVYAINPLASAIGGFRAALLGTPAPSAVEYLIAVSSAAAFLASGMLYFRRTERIFADVI